MTEFRSHMTVELIDHMGPDSRPAEAARASTGTDPSKPYKGLTRKLMTEEPQHSAPFEHCTMTLRVEVPKRVAWEWMRHRTQCIAGDTEITFSSGVPYGNQGTVASRKKTIANHYEHWHNGVSDTLGRVRHLPSVKNATVLSLNEETGEKAYSAVLDVIQSGVKPVYRMVTQRGREVKATKDHKFLTINGWKVLGDISVGDYLITHHLSFTDRSDRRIVPASLRAAINTWTSSVKKEVYDGSGGKCEECEASIALEDAICDHRVPVVLDLEKALSMSNLRVLCRSCDKVKTGLEQAYAGRKRAVGETMFTSPDYVTSIEAAGEEMTYDLVLDDPHHNFIGNGIVTHNSFSELSTRYAHMDPVFYVPPMDRPIMQSGKPMDYTRDLADQVTHDWVVKRRIELATAGVERYEEELERGVSREIAADNLPMFFFTTFYATGNLRNWLNFLYLRGDKTALWEIQDAAMQVEAIIARLWPTTYTAWKNKQGEFARLRELYAQSRYGSLEMVP